MQYKLFGCKVNKYFLNQWLNHFIENPPLERGLRGVIIASCEVTDRAKKKYIKEIISHAKNGKDIYLTGCGSIVRGKKIDEKTFYDRYPELKERQNNITLLSESPPKKETTKKTNEIATRKAIIIQTGCDNYCTFCLTVRKRGAHQSRAASDIIHEINTFQQAGGHEIVITGINLAARGCENSTKPEQSKFSDLLEQIIQETSIPRIRVSSLGPEYLDDKFFEIIQNSRFMNHFHISIQSFSDNILKAMKRNYDSKLLDKILTKFQKIYKPPFYKGGTQGGINIGLSLGADIITGFPGETEEDFQITYDAIKKYNITKLHAFPFSPHQKGETIPASFLEDQIPQEVKKSRNQKLIAQGDNIRQNFINTQKGKSFQVLLEQEKNGHRHGWTENYIEVKLDSHTGDYKENQIVSHVL